MMILQLSSRLYFPIIPPAFGYIATLIAFSLIHQIEGSAGRNPPVDASARRVLQNDTMSASNIFSPHDVISPGVQSPVIPSPDSNSPISPPNLTCIDTSNWKDLYDNGCDWYEELDERCSGFSSWYEGTMGAANDNCCHCRRGGEIDDYSMNFTLINNSIAPSPIPSTISNDTFPLGTSPTCYDTPGWYDPDGWGCDWYVRNEDPGCPAYGSWYDGPMGVANDHCCHCMNATNDTFVSEY